MFPKHNLQVQGMCKVATKTRNTWKNLRVPDYDSAENLDI